MSSIPSELRERFEQYDQQHVFQFVDKNLLSEKQIEALVKDLEELNLERIQSIYQASMAAASNTNTELGEIQPLDSYDSVADASPEQIEQWTQKGKQALVQNQVAALVLAGGQGTRLGFKGPKGCYNIGLPSQKSLFQLFAERIGKLEQEAGPNAVIPLYVMTSQMNDQETRDFFAQNKYFGLKESQLFFFAQGTLPCLTKEGKIIMESGHKVARASDGNGGIYHAVSASGALADMETRGIESVHVFSVDNALCKLADPTFIGYCKEQDADCGNKVVWKTDAKESVGVVAKRGGKYCVVEYSEMDLATAAQMDSSNEKLLYGAGNICNHYYSVDFLKRVLSAGELEFHIAHKKIPYADDNGNTVTPTSNTGIKLEAFIFDVFPLSQKMAVLEVPRDEEFSPVKNAPGKPVDSPDSARLMISGQSCKWLKAAGAKFAEEKLTSGTVSLLSGDGSCNQYFVYDAYTNLLSCYPDEASASNGSPASLTTALLSLTLDASDPNTFQCKTAAGKALTCKSVSADECKKWISAFDPTTIRLCEISPLLSYNGEGLSQFIGKEITLPCYLE